MKDRGGTGPPSAYMELCKAGLTSLVVATCAVGFVLGHGTWGSGIFPWGRMIWTLLGTFLLAGGSVAMNQAWEWRRDARMGRTRHRPVPTGRIPFFHALRFGGTCIAVGLLILITRSGPLPASLGLLNAAIYVLVYTPLKPRTPLCTLVGAICGAVPPMMGWAAAVGRLDLGAWILAAMLFLWQIPHFLALAWLYREDYERGGFRVLPVIDRSGNLTAGLAVLYTLAAIPVAIVSAHAGMGGRVFLAGALALGLGLLLIAIRLMRSRTEARARALFLASIIYLPIFLTLLIVDRGGGLGF